jgi:hypothetical protein
VLPSVAVASTYDPSCTQQHAQCWTLHAMAGTVCCQTTFVQPCEIPDAVTCKTPANCAVHVWHSAGKHACATVTTSEPPAVLSCELSGRTRIATLMLSDWLIPVCKPLGTCGVRRCCEPSTCCILTPARRHANHQSQRQGSRHLRMSAAMRYCKVVAKAPHGWASNASRAISPGALFVASHGEWTRVPLIQRQQVCALSFRAQRNYPCDGPQVEV